MAEIKKRNRKLKRAVSTNTICRRFGTIENYTAFCREWVIACLRINRTAGNPNRKIANKYIKNQIMKGKGESKMKIRLDGNFEIVEAGQRFNLTRSEGDSDAQNIVSGKMVDCIGEYVKRANMEGSQAINMIDYAKMIDRACGL